MKWLTRLFAKLKSSAMRETPTTTAKPAPAAPVKSAEPEPAAATGPLPEPPAPAESPEPAEPSATSADPAINKLDSEREAATLPGSPADDEPAAEKSAEEPAADQPEAPAVEAKLAAEKPAAAEPAATPAAPEKPAPKPATVEKPAAGDGPFGPGSAKPLPDGGAPGEEFTVKGKRSSKLFHTAESPYFGRTKADVWFKTPADAESAGFAAWNHKKKAAAK